MMTHALEVPLHVEAATPEEANPTTHERVVMSVVFHQNMLGVAVYNETTREISLCELFDHEQDFARLQLLKFQVQPTLIVTSSASNRNQSFVEALKRDVESEALTFKVEFFKASEFTYAAAKHRALLLQLPDMPPGLNQQDKSNFLGALMPLDQIQMIRSLGGLISYLLKCRIVNELESRDELISIDRLSVIPVVGALRIDMGTLKALSVFSVEPHPSSHGIGKAKEGFSLFSLYRPNTPLGKRLLRKWFLLPQTNINLLDDRLRHIDYLLHTGTLLEDIGSVAVKYVRDLPRVLARIQTASASVPDWAGLLQTLVGCIRLKELCDHHELRLFRELAASVDESLFDLAHTLASTIDFEASKEFSRLTVKEGVHAPLDDLRDSYQNLDYLLTTFAKEELATLATPLIDSLSIVYYPQVGYQIAVPTPPEVEMQLYVQELGRTCSLEYQFHTSKYVYFKNSFMKELDQSDELGDIWGKISDMESSILLALEAVVVARSLQLTRVVNSLAELDCFVAMAACAKQYKWRAPVLCETNCLNIKNGRHPLQELCDEMGAFIPNDTKLNEDGDRVLVISGANGSGKSVYMKQVGLITFMAHVGSFVPADEATIGLTDQIFSRIYSRETASVRTSSFMIDLSQVAAMLRHATERSLLLLDEFGKGTNVVDGVSVLGGALRHLLSRGFQIPKVVVSTHFGEYFYNPTLLPQTQLLVFAHMDVFVEEPEQQERQQQMEGTGGEVVFLYKLKPGCAKQSCGHYMSQLSGVPQAIVERAAVVKALFVGGEPVQPLHAGLAQRRKQEFEAIRDRFLGVDCAVVEVRTFLAEVWAMGHEETPAASQAH